MNEVEKPTPVEFLGQGRVFFVGSTTDKTVLVAVHPTFQEKAGTLSWWDTVRERVKQIKSMQVGEEPVLQVTDVQDNTYIFVPLSLSLYNNMVRNRLSGRREFVTQEEMIKAFEESIKSE